MYDPDEYKSRGTPCPDAKLITGHQNQLSIRCRRSVGSHCTTGRVTPPLGITDRVVIQPRESLIPGWAGRGWAEWRCAFKALQTARKCSRSSSPELQSLPVGSSVLSGATITDICASHLSAKVVNWKHFSWLINCRLLSFSFYIRVRLAWQYFDVLWSTSGSHGAIWCSFASLAGPNRLFGCSGCRCTDSYAAEGVPRHSRPLQGTHWDGGLGELPSWDQWEQLRSGESWDGIVRIA